MVQANTPLGCALADAEADPATRVAHATTRLTKVYASLRQHLPQARPGTDVTAFPLLFALAHGPLRVSALAERMFSDVSTVSRQVSNLERQGLLGREPDPADGRASLIALTDEGVAFIQELVQRRTALFHHILTDWAPQEVETLADLLERLIADTVRHTDDLLGRTHHEGTTP